MSSIFFAPTLAAVALLCPPAGTCAIQTYGFQTIGDGGAGLYVGPCSQPNHDGKVKSADGNWWELCEDFPHVLQFGAVDNGTTTDDTAAFNSLASYCNAKARCAWVRPNTVGFATNGGHTFNWGFCGYGGGWGTTIYIIHPTNRIIYSCNEIGSVYSGIHYLAAVSRTAESTVYIDAPAGKVTYRPIVTKNVFQGGYCDIAFLRSTIGEVTSNFSTDYSGNFLILSNIDHPDNGDHYIAGNTWDTGCATAGSGILQYNAGGAKIFGNKGGRGLFAYELALIGPAAGSTSVLIIEGNSFENQTAGMIRLRRAAGSAATFDKVIIAGNEGGGDMSNPAIILDDNSGFISRTIVTGNILQFTGIGIAAYSTKKLIISDNVLHAFGGASVGISIDAGASGRIGHNEFDNVTTPIINYSPNVSIAA